MKEHIAYAMRNEEATQSLIYFNSPSELLDWSFLAIESMLLVGVVLAIAHAYRHFKHTGSPSALLTLLGCFLYGLAMDIISYYTVESFWHGEFSVMFLYNKLPLYIALFYTAFMYHAVMIIRRYEFKPLTEAICTGFYAGFMYLIFDNLGPMLQWWVWDTQDPTNWPLLNSVPLTSYHWFFTFTAGFTLVNRLISYEWIAQKKSTLLITIAILLQPAITMIVGGTFFAPYNLFAQSFPPYTLLPWDQNLNISAFIHALFFAGAGLLFFFNWKRPNQLQDKLLMAFPIIYLLGHAYIYIAKFDLFVIDGQINPLAGNLIAVLIALIGTTTIVMLSHPKEQKAE